MTLEQLEILNAVVTEGSFRAAADSLWKTQPAVSIAIKKLEKEFGITLFDRKNYRATLTENGRAFYQKCQVLLRETDQLKSLGKFLSSGDEPYLKISINIVSPLPSILTLLKKFFDEYPNTQPELYFDVLKGSLEKLDQENVDLSFSSILPEDSSYETIFLAETVLIPVTAPGYLPHDSNGRIADEELKNYSQIIVSDTSKKRERRQYGVLPGGKQWTVSDMHVKKEIILAGMGWGSLPEYLIEKEIDNGKLIPLVNKSVSRFPIEIHAVRQKNKLHGPVAEALWQKLQSFSEN